MLSYVALESISIVQRSTSQRHNDINLTVFVPCALGGAGEVVDLAGPLHTLITFTINRNNVSSKFHFPPQQSVELVRPVEISIRRRR